MVANNTKNSVHSVSTTPLPNRHAQAAAERLKINQTTGEDSADRGDWIIGCAMVLAIVSVIFRLTIGSHSGGFSTSTPEQQINHAIVMVFWGAVVGAFFSQRLKRFRRLLVLLAVALACGIVLIAPEPIDFPAYFLVGAVITWLFLRVSASKPAAKDEIPKTFGSAKWADLAHMLERGLIGETGFLLGWFYEGVERFSICYAGTRHLLTFGPNGSGKGVAAIIPNLLSYLGSVFAIDVKGELAAITAAARRRLGQVVYTIDPWGIVPGEKSSRWNPLDMLDPSSEDLAELSMMIADALIVSEGKGDEFWNEEAKSLLNGLILYVVLSANFEGERHLGTVRDLMNAPAEKFDLILADMSLSSNPIVSSTAARTLAKTEKLRANVLTTLQAHTHFLDSPRIRENMRCSDLRYEDLKNNPATVYLVIPADRLIPFSRWSRLHIQMMLTAAARDIQNKPERPLLVMIDEMASLGRLAMVEIAFGLLSGFGVVLWGIFQDFSQLDKIYQKGAETFVANAGVIQYFGSRDERTATYMSKLCGVTTVMKWSITKAISRALGINRSSSHSASGGGSSSSGWSHTETESSSTAQDVIQRSLAYPDELMVMRRDQSLLLVENNNPISAGKIVWYKDDRFKSLGVDLKGRSTPAGRPAENGAAKPAFGRKTELNTKEVTAAAV